METDTLERFKVLMESVTTINDSAMDAEIRLAEMREMYSTLQSYDYPINQAEMTDLTALPREWKELRNLAHRKTRQLASIKTKFAGEKKQEVRKCTGSVSKTFWVGRNVRTGCDKCCMLSQCLTGRGFYGRVQGASAEISRFIVFGRYSTCGGTASDDSLRGRNCRVQG